MQTFFPLFSQVVDSSLWEEPYYLRVLFLTMMAKKDSDHIVRGSAFNISKWANMTEREVLEGLKVLSSPDTRRLEPQEYEGRRIERSDGGWLILNGQKYEDLMKLLAERMKKARWAREHRAKVKAMKMVEGMGTKTETGLKDLEDRIEKGHISNEPEPGLFQ